MPTTTPDWIDPDLNAMSGADEGKAPVNDPMNAPPDEPRRSSGDRGDAASESTEQTIARLTIERNDAIAARQRSLADFANFQRRANEAESRAASSGAARVLRSLLGPIDHLDLALGGRSANATPQQVLEGVRMVREEFTRMLESHGVSAIIAQRGDEFDPTRHEAMMRQPAPDLPPNAVVQTLQPGYAMGDTVLRPAKVVVAG